MKTDRALLAITSLWLLGTTFSPAQNTAFTYQGRVTSGGAPFSGVGQFKFALVTSTNANQRATATANLSGPFVVSYNVTSGGTGYITPPAVTIFGGGGSGATAHATISGGVVTSVLPDSAGSGYTSAPTVAIAPPPANISFTSFWSNDGTSVAGSEPSAAIGVPVSNGLFTVVLGDTTLPNMAAIEASLFLQPRLQLRIWFNDGVNGFAALQPPQDLTPAPYAVVAGSLAAPVSSANLSGTYSSAVNFQNASNTFAGTFAGNGGGLSNVSAHALVIDATNTSITTWGNNQFGQRNPPTSLGDVMELAAGTAHSLALKTDGTVVAWGAGQTYNAASLADRGQSMVPAGLANVTAIAAGYLHSLALKSDGTVVVWGDNDYGQTNLPALLNNVRSISAGAGHSLALRRDGTIVAWGTNSGGQLSVPAGLNSVKAVSAGWEHSLALLSNGTIVAWGSNQHGETNVPAGLNGVTAISAGSYHNLALLSDGTVVAWGAGKTNDLNTGVHFGQSIVPPGLHSVVAIVAGNTHSLALKSDGTIVGWGTNTGGQANPPPGIKAITLASGSAALHAMALRRRASAPVAVLDSDNTFNGSIQVNGDLSVASDLRLNDANLWLRGGLDQDNGLGWFGTGKAFDDGFNDFAPNGPVLFGSQGGALGTSSNNQHRVALSWDTARRVGIGTTTPGARLSLGNDQAGTKLLVHDTGANSGAGIGFTNAQFRFHLPGSSHRFAFLDAPSGGNELLSIFSGSGPLSGFVGVGTVSPSAKLHVNGDIRMANGYLAAGGTENLRIIRGVVNSSGVVLEGSGFTASRTSTGVYSLTFSSSFIGAPAVTANAQTTAPRVVTTPGVTASSAGVRIFFMDLNPADVQFSFIAIGPR